ncbi:MAG: HAD-IC family P-type ATPase, partial [Bacteroidia bacterium]|nr:HAD-IC family P-type ATPase [Bacteroidia bacterium]
TAEAKKIKEKESEMIRDIERIIRVAGVLIIPIGILLIYQSMYVNGYSYQTAVISMVGAIAGMIPEGLYLLVTIALTLSASRLAKKQVLLHDMKSIEALARVDVLCVDKTGTITSNEMNVTGILGSHNESDEDIEKAKDILAKYIQTIPDNNITMNALRDFFVDKKELLNSTEIMPFSSKTKYSEIKTKDATYRLGAPEFLLNEKQMEKNKEIIESQTSTGKRVLAFVEENNNKTNPILFIALHNEIRENAKETFEYFQEQGIEIKVISGDNPQTVSKVAMEAGIKNADKYIDASKLDTEEKIKEAIRTYTVFGRVKPEQKKQIVEAIKFYKVKVAMTGDGVNDILAMKEADCSIAMGVGSDAARQAAQVVLLDSDFSKMKNIIYEGRRNINNITRSATLFLYKNIFSLALAIFSIVAVFNYPLKPTQISMISMFNIGLPAFLLAFEKNEKKQEGSFIKTVLTNSIPAALTSFFAIIAMIYFANLFGISKHEVATASTYLISVVGFNILWYITRPMNKYRILVFAVCLFGIASASRYLYGIFDMNDISIKATALCIVFSIAEMTVIRDLTYLLNKLVGNKIER